MSKPGIIWIASYPRSGNTLLRTVLWHCFGLRSGSVYPDDFGGRKALEEYVGHIELGPDRRITFPDGGLPLVKTHEYPIDDDPAIYVVRDGRAASVSLWEFYRRSMSLEAVIRGQHRFGTWSAHLAAWKPWERPDTLLLKYEDIMGDLAAVLDRIATFIGRDPVSTRIPDRRTLATADGRWVRNESDWLSKIADEPLELCDEVNREMLHRMGYPPGRAGPGESFGGPPDTFRATT